VARPRLELNEAEVRVLGCLVEKQRTTPDAYPLTLNSLRLACNQATNRDPVMDLDEPAVRTAAQRLGERGLARFASGHSGRVAKYRHVLREALGLADGEIALLGVLALRGPQTPGELAARGARLHPFAEGELEAGVDRLEAEGLAKRLDRRPGQKEARIAHLLGADGAPEGGKVAAPEERAVAPPEGQPDGERLARLERAVSELRDELAELRRELGA
jgi:uncharacterized protein